MEPLQGWGPPPWSLTPKAETLSLTLCLLLLRVPHGALAMALCKEEEFPVGAQCCPKCSPGHRVKEACGETTGTVCAPCSPGTYTAHLNGLDECLHCRVCDPDMGLVTRRKCSSTGNTVCGCARGHFCVQEGRDECAECRPHSDCRPGQRVQQTGTEWEDTVCEDCPPGTFSAGRTQAVCERWTNSVPLSTAVALHSNPDTSSVSTLRHLHCCPSVLCSGILETEAKPGTSSTDVTCSSSVKVAILCVCTVLIVITVIVLLGYLGSRIRRSHEVTTQRTHGDQWRRQQTDLDTTADQAPQVSLILPDVTTVAVEETASTFHDRHPPADECFRVQTSENLYGAC